MTWLEQQVRNASLRQIAVCVTIIAGMIAMLVFNQRYLTNAYTGVYDMPRAELLAASSAGDLSRYWVRVKPDEVRDSGVDAISTSTRKGRTTRTVTGHYWVGRVGERLLLIKGHGEPTIQTAMLDGALLSMPTDITIPDKIRNSFLPFMLDTADFTTDAITLLAIAGIVSALALGWALWATSRAVTPAGHPALMYLAAMPGQSLAEASQAIAADIKARRTTKMRDGVQLTAGHLVQSTALGFKVLPLADLLWTYPIVTTKKLYGVIPTGKSHSAAFFFVGKQMTLKGSEKQTMDAMRHVSYAAPWTLIGHSGDIEKAYKKDRKNLIGFIQGRRMQSLAAAQSPPPAGTAPSA